MRPCSRCTAVRVEVVLKWMGISAIDFLKRVQFDDVRFELKGLVLFRSDVQRGGSSSEVDNRAAIHFAHFYKGQQFRLVCRRQRLVDCLTVLVIYWQSPLVDHVF